MVHVEHNSLFSQNAMFFNNISAFFVKVFPVELVVEGSFLPSIRVSFIKPNLRSILKQDVKCFVSVAQTSSAKRCVLKFLIVDLKVCAFCNKILNNLRSVSITCSVKGSFSSWCDMVNVHFNLFNEELNDIEEAAIYCLH